MTETPRRSMVTFGAVMLIIAGVINLLDGFVGIVRPETFNGDPLVASVAAWAWFFAAFGVLQLALGAAVLRGSVVALWPAIVVAAFNAVTQLVDVAHYPVWAITIVAVDFVVIYNFAVEGMRAGTVEVPQ